MRDLRLRYLDLLAGCLSRELFLELDEPGVDPADRHEGRDWPATAETMIGRRRLDNLIDCLATVLDDDIPGDVIETGVWRGGATILMRAALAAWEDPDRSVWVADSFNGLPPPDAAAFPADEGVDLSGIGTLAVSRAEVASNFERYGLLDDRVRFLEGWFADTLSSAPISRLALIRLDGDPSDRYADFAVAGPTCDSVDMLPFPFRLPEDIREGDVGAILGWGFAPWSGGPFGWLDIIGAEYAAERCDQLAAKYGERFKCPDLLREMAEKGQSFYSRFAPEAKAA